MRALCLRFLPFCLSALVLLTAFAAHPANGQAPASKPGDAAAKAVADYSQEPFYLVSSNSLYVYHDDGTGYREQTIVAKIQSDATLRQLGVLSVVFAGKSEEVQYLYARVRRPDGTVVETAVDDALEEAAPITREAPFYSDIKQKELPVRSMRVGDTLEWKVRITRKVPEAPHEFWGQDSFTTEGVVLAETVELRVPAARHIIVWTNKADGTPPAESTENGEHIYRWTHANLKPTVGAEAEKARKDKEARTLTEDEELNAEEGTLPSLAFTTFANWAAIGDWYRALEHDRIIPDATVKAKVAELTTGLTTDEARARALYTYVATQIRYIGVALGVGRYQPHAASEVLANQYGDCKDKHTLLAAMFTAAGLPSDAVLIGYGVRFNPDVPSPEAFNHLITHLKLDGQYVWLDTTAEVAPWRALFPQIRDEDALVVPDNAPATIQHTPDGLPFAAYFHATITGTLSPDFTADSTINLTYRDDDELMLRAALRQVTAAQYGVVVQRIMAGYGFGGTTSDADFKHLAEISEPLTISFHYQRVKEQQWGVNRVTIPFILPSIPGVNPDKPATSTLRLGVPRIETTTVELTLPLGWTAELPEATHTKSPFAACDITYRLDGGGSDGKTPRVFHAERRITVLQAKVSTEQWERYKTWYVDADPTSIPYLQLIRVGGKGSKSDKTMSITGGTVRLPPPVRDDKYIDKDIKDAHPFPTVEPPPPGATAESLVEEARAQISDTATARKLLDQAQTLNPKQRGLWTGYAGIAYMLGMPNESIDDIRKELEYHPDELELYQMVAEQERAHDPEAALATMRKWVDAAPDSADAAAALVNFEARIKRNEDGVKDGSAALKHLSAVTPSGEDLTQLRLALARAQATTGHKTEAALTDRPLLDTATDPGVLNDAAYEVADAAPNGASPNLTLAAEKQRTVLEKLSAQTATWTLDESPTLLRTRTYLLVAAWDTMGWILFREGQPAEARPFVEASWRNHPNAELTEHLKAIDAALHKPSQGTAESEQQLRTLPLGPSNGRHGTAELQLLLSAGKVVRAEPPINVEIPGGVQLPEALSAPRLAGAAELAKKANVQRLFPPGSTAQLVRKSIVNCSGETCNLILEPL